MAENDEYAKTKNNNNGVFCAIMIVLDKGFAKARGKQLR